MVKNFSRNKEDFICLVCGKTVQGNGYTDHCPECLCSLHVDINPGDRACQCHGILRPVGLEYKNQKQYILYRCEKCGYRHRNKVADNDSFKALLQLAKEKNFF